MFLGEGGDDGGDGGPIVGAVIFFRAGCLVAVLKAVVHVVVGLR